MTVRCDGMRVAVARLTRRRAPLHTATMSLPFTRKIGRRADRVTKPQAGDVVIHQSLLCSIGCYPDRTVFITQDATLASHLALRFGRQHLVDVWSTHDRKVYRVLARFRRTSAPAHCSVIVRSGLPTLD